MGPYAGVWKNKGIDFSSTLSPPQFITPLWGEKRLGLEIAIVKMVLIVMDSDVIGA